MTNTHLDNYYERKPTRTLVNGRWKESFKQPLDDQAEEVLLKILQREFHLFKNIMFLRTSERFAGLDFMIVQNDTELIGVAELKRRNTKRGKYNTVPLNLRKVEAFKNHVAKGIACIYFVMWADYIGYIDVRKAVTADLGTIGTTKRMKSNTDMNDPCHLIPVEWFTILCETPQLQSKKRKQKNTRKR